MKPKLTPKWWMAILFGVLAVLALWEAWAVFSARSMTAVSCDGLFSGTLCTVRILVGRLLFGESGAHLGFVAIACALGVWLLYMAWVSDKYFRAGTHAVPKHGPPE
jgi:CDP-diglyceride synthetase